MTFKCNVDFSCNCKIFLGLTHKCNFKCNFKCNVDLLCNCKIFLGLTFGLAHKCNFKCNFNFNLGATLT